MKRMTFQLLFQVAVLVSVTVYHCGSITLSCTTSKPKDQESLSCTCTNPTKNGVAWKTDSVLTTTCVGSTDSCFPVLPEYTSDVSKDEFYLQISPYSHTHCATYMCEDTTTGKNESFTSSIAAFDNSTITSAEPGANTDGPISITTDCVFSPTDLKIKWYKLQDGSQLVFEDPVESNDRSTCTRTCNSLEDQKVTSGFTHTEFNGSNSVEVQFMVTVSHSSYSEQFTWTSATYKVERDCKCECECKCGIFAGLSMAFGILGASGLLIAIGGICIECFDEKKKQKTLLLASGVIGFVCGVLSLGFSIVVKVIGCCEEKCEDSECCKDDSECCKDDSECCKEDSECCDDWIDNAATAFIVIPCVAVVVSVVIFILVKFNIIGPGRNAYKATEHGENHGMTGTSM